MNTKTIIFSLTMLVVLSLFSFKANTSDDSPKTILISALNGSGENEGIIITYGDGKKETRPFITKIKGLNADTWVQYQLQTTIILNEFKEKGYHYVGSHKLMTETMILEKD